MDTSHISHRELLERVLPRESLRPDLRELIESALRDESTETHEATSRRVVRALVADGVFREVAGSGDGPYTYLNRATGGRLVIDWTRAPSASPPDIRVPIPPDTMALRVPLATVDAILRLDAPPEHEDAHDGANATVVRRALDILTTLLPGDFVAYVPADAEAAGTIDASSREVRYIPEWTDTRTLRPPAPGFRSVAFAPVHAGATRIGHLEVWGRVPRLLTEEHVVTLALFAHHLGESLERAAAYEKVAFYDAPTGLFNRQFFDMQLEREIARARRAGEAFALAIVDIDDFKSINTRFGYMGGNDLLEQLAQLLAHSVRPFDVAARWGGEEFALILTPPVGEQEAAAICNRIRGAAEDNPYSVTGLDGNRHAVRLTVSVGVSVFPDLAASGRELWMTANEALHRAKSTGKNRVVVYGEQEKT